MSITTKSTLVLVAIFAALLSGAWLILEHVVRPSFVQQEQAAHESDRARLAASLDGISRDMRARALDYARWDDTFAYVQGQYPAYVADNFSDEWFSNYAADLVIIADENGRLLHSQERGVHAGLGAGGLAGAIVEQALAVAPRRSIATAGVIWTARGPLLYGAARPTRSDGAGPTKGLIIIGRHLNSGALEQQVQVSLRFVNASNVPANLTQRFAELAGQDAVSWTTDTDAYSLTALHGGDDSLAGAILTQKTRDLAALADRTITGTLIMLTLMFAFSIGALGVLIRRMVIARVVKLERHFHAQDGVMFAAPEDDSKDEIGHLTRAYNALSGRLAEAINNEHNAMAAQEIAAAANKMKSDFLANISHELRTPLNDVIGYAELIEEDLADAGFTSSGEDLRRIGDAARHLLTLTNEILDLSRIEAERLDIRPEEFRIDELLRSTVDTASVLARAQSSLLRVECEGDLGNAYSDQSRWRQCLVNVLAYACKRTHSGVVRLKAERRTTPTGDVLRFEVVDQGAPLNKAQSDALFEPYLRSESAQTPVARLGLSVTRKLVGLIGGSIDVHIQPRRGCVFVLTLKASLDLDTPGSSSAAA